MVMDRNDGVVIAFCQCADHVRNAFLHFWISTLNGIKLDGVVILAGFYG